MGKRYEGEIIIPQAPITEPYALKMPIGVYDLRLIRAKEDPNPQLRSSASPPISQFPSGFRGPSGNY